MLCGDKVFKRKVYGESRLPACPLCSRNAIAKNDQGIPVCESHRSQRIDDLKCACGAAVELRLGKWGPYGSCESCGNVSWSKLCVINSMSKDARPQGGRTIDLNSGDIGAENFEQRPKAGKPREAAIRSDDPEGRPVAMKQKNHPKELTIRSDDPDFF